MLRSLPNETPMTWLEIFGEICNVLSSVGADLLLAGFVQDIVAEDAHEDLVVYFFVLRDESVIDSCRSKKLSHATTSAEPSFNDATSATRMSMERCLRLHKEIHALPEIQGIQRRVPARSYHL